MALTCSLTLIFHIRFVKNPILVSKGRYHTSTLSCIGCIGNIWPSRGKPVLFLNFDAFPRRIPQHHIKSTRPSSLFILRYLTFRWHSKDIGEGQVPVEELVLLSQAYDFITHPG